MQAYFDPIQKSLWVNQEPDAHDGTSAPGLITTHHAAEITSRQQAADQLASWGFRFSGEWKHHASGLGYKTSPLVEAVGLARATCGAQS